jgi:hypothetical protein
LFLVERSGCGGKPIAQRSEQRWGDGGKKGKEGVQLSAAVDETHSGAIRGYEAKRLRAARAV